MIYQANYGGRFSVLSLLGEENKPRAPLGKVQPSEG